MLTPRDKWVLGPTILLTTILGCRMPPEGTAERPPAQHEACNTGDSPAICVQVQKCFESNVSTVVCRELEDDAIQVSKQPTQPADNGAAHALNY